MPADIHYRCGVTDNPAARGVVSKWGIKDLTYAITTGLTGANFPASQYPSIVAEALSHVPKVCGLSLRPASDPSNANLLIGAGRGQRAGFDGQSGGILAHCELPYNDNYRGQLHLMMDLDEIWAIAGGSLPRSAILAINVLRHEVGHFCGLNHLTTPNQLLNAYYSERINTYQSEDIAELQSRYGPPSAQPVPPTPIPTPDPGSPSPAGLHIAAKLWVNGTIIGPKWMTEPPANALTAVPPEF